MACNGAIIADGCRDSVALLVRARDGRKICSYLVEMQSWGASLCIGSNRYDL